MKENKGKFGLKRRNNLALIFSNVKIKLIIHALCWKLTLIYIEVSYYHSSKSISGSKNLMYTTIKIVPRKFKEKVYNRK